MVVTIQDKQGEILKLNLDMAVLQAALEYVENNPVRVLVAVLVLVLASLYRWVVTRKPASPNPFRVDARKPKKPLVTDQSMRDKVLKQGFVARRVPENLDAIVIGSGIGGLGAAALLAKAGRKVLVLEQHDQAGGCCHSFIEKGFEFDVGIHYVGKLQQPSHVKTLLEQISSGQMTWAPLDKVFDIVVLGEPGKHREIPLRWGIEEFRQSLIDAFPDEVDAIDKYMAMLKRSNFALLGYGLLKMLPLTLAKILWTTGLINLITRYGKWGRISTQDFIDSITKNEQLKAVLAYSYGDYGTSPSESSILMQTALINHFMKGASYPAGGASEISFHIIPTIEAAGGQVLVRAKVTNIIFEDGKAVGVQVSKGGETHSIYAPNVISNAGLLNTMNMIPREIAEKSTVGCLKKDGHVRNGTGAMSLFVGLRGTTEELGLKAQNVWAFTEFNLAESFSNYLQVKPDPQKVPKIPLLFISFPSAKDPTHAERYPGKSTATVITMASWEWFSEWGKKQVKKRGDDYEALKQALGQQMWKQVLGLYPQLEDKVEYFEVASPITNDYYIGSNKGEMYGLDHDMKRFDGDVCMKLRPDIGIPGLYLTGQDVMTCGFSGALNGGLSCASTILDRNLYLDCQNLHDRIIKSDAEIINGTSDKKSN